MALRFIVLAAIGLTLVFAGIRAWNRWGETSLRVTFFDIGQGDAALVQWPGGKAWLIDGGGGRPGRDLGARILFPELTRLGILTLDEAILSHPDQDHGLGFESLFADLTVKTFRFNRKFLGERGLMRRLQRLALVKGIALEAVDGEGLVPMPGGSAQMMALEGGTGKNDRTLAVAIEFAGCRLLFTGDMEKAGEAELLQRWPNARADLVKVPHHGSHTSSTAAFLERLKPRWGVVSVGKGNTYGHPVARVLERYHARRISLLRTDFHGFVTVRIAPSGEISCESALGDCGRASCQATSN